MWRIRRLAGVYDATFWRMFDGEISLRRCNQIVEALLNEYKLARYDYLEAASIAGRLADDWPGTYTLGLKKSLACLPAWYDRMSLLLALYAEAKAIANSDAVAVLESFLDTTVDLAMSRILPQDESRDAYTELLRLCLTVAAPSSRGDMTAYARAVESRGMVVLPGLFVD